MAVAVLDADVYDIVSDGDWYWSDCITCKRHGEQLVRSGALLRELSLVRATANCGTRPVVAVRGDISRGTASQPRRMPLSWDSTWERAAEAMPRQRYRRAQHTLIVEVDVPEPAPAAVPAVTTSGPVVNWFGQPLGGELAERVLDAIEFGTYP
jgi:hypothetical protein